MYHDVEMWAMLHSAKKFRENTQFTVKEFVKQSFIWLNQELSLKNFHFDKNLLENTQSLSAIIAAFKIYCCFPLFWCCNRINDVLCFSHISICSLGLSNEGSFMVYLGCSLHNDISWQETNTEKLQEKYMHNSRRLLWLMLLLCEKSTNVLLSSKEDSCHFS